MYHPLLVASAKATDGCHPSRWEHFELRGLWKPWIDDFIPMNILKVNMTNLMTWRTWQKLMVGFGCDTIPILQYNHNTWIWVGLNWKLMYLSMGSLWTSANEVMPKAASTPHLNWNTWTAYAVPDWLILSLLVGPAHRGGACTRVCNWKVSIDYPHTKYDYSGLSLTDVSNVVVKVYPLCRV